MYIVGAGNMIVMTTSVDNAGEVVYGTPRTIGVTQSIDFSVKNATANLNGQYNVPIDTVTTTSEADLKVSFGAMSGSLIGDILFNQPMIPGGVTSAIGERYPYAATITVANAATFAGNLGVINTRTGAALKYVLTPPNSGEYNVDLVAGIYTFSAADAPVKNPASNLYSISYSYTITDGQSFTAYGSLIGQTPKVRGIIDMIDSRTGKQLTIDFPRLIAANSGINTKQSGYAYPTMDFKASADDDLKFFYMHSPDLV